MMNRVRRSGGRQKSPSSSEESYTINKSSGTFSVGIGGSPILTHRPSGTTAGGLGMAYAINFGGGGGYKSTQQQKSLLQSVIRNLVDSEEEEDRQAQRKKLESDLAINSERLQDLVHEHRDKLHGTLSTFDEVDAKVRDSQSRIKEVRANLKSCKSLLRCKREELKRLWLEDIKYKHMLKMIESIEEVMSVPDKLVKFKRSRHYLHATELLMNSVAKLEGELLNVEALKDLKQELLQQKEILHEELIDELHRHLYTKPTGHKPHLQGRNNNEVGVASSARKKTSTLTRITRNAKSPTAMDNGGRGGGGGEDDVVRDDIASGLDPEEDSGHYMAVLVEALSILGRVQDALDAIQQRMEKEFLLIMERASIQVTRSYDNETGITNRRKGRGYVRENVPKLLTKMLQICFEQFHHVVYSHRVLLTHFNRTKRTYKAPYDLYQESDVWAAIQRVVQSALEVYLAYDDDESASPDQISGFAAFTSAGDAHSVFSRRKAQTNRVTKKPLFKFDSSRHAISISSYMREQRDLELTGGGEGGGGGVKEQVAARHFEQNQPSISQHLVCQPHNRNITVVFCSVRDFVEEIEETMDLPPGENCPLHHFLNDYVEQDFLFRIRSEYFDKMANSAKPECAKATAPDQKTLKMTGSKICVLNSVLTVWQLVDDLRQLMKDLPMYSGDFLTIICELLVGYKESLHLLYRGLTVVSVEHAPTGRHGGGNVGGASFTNEGVLSSKWARDEDIVRTIKSLSSWMKVRQGLKIRGSEDERLQSVYTKESELLTKNISGQLQKHDVILSHDNLRLLAIIHESMEWFSSQLRQVVLEMTSSTSDMASDATDGATLSRQDVHATPTLADDLELVEQLSSVRSEFHNLAETTLIMLHLEVRCHCFYFLLPALQKASYVFDHSGVGEDKIIQHLAADLKDTDLVMVAVLNPSKYRYLFEGLGHLVASIFIASTQHIKSINSDGIKRMCRNISVLQSCLSKITLIREKDLDRARKYFEMLYLTFDEVIEGLLEHGPYYSQQEYARALSLLAHSPARGEGSHDRDEMLKLQLQQLEDIFSGDTV